MFNYDEFSVNESLASSIGDYNLVKSPRGNYYRHKNSKELLNDSYLIESDGYISVDGNLIYKDSDIANIPFLFKKITGNFSCTFCKSLTSLVGCPQIVNNFSLGSCNMIKSLEGSPNIVNDNFFCGFCDSLSSFKGCPYIINGYFEIHQCPLISLLDHFQCMIKGEIIIDDKLKYPIQIIQSLYHQYPLLSQIEDYALFVHTIIGYAPELKKYYKEIPKISDHHQDLSTFL